MGNERMLALVKFTREGFHHWPDAPLARGYLGTDHRHLFYVEVRLEVHHDEREVEYHDLLDLCKCYFPGGKSGGQSCETMARTLAENIATTFPGRLVEVSILEDNEVGAVFTLPCELGTSQEK